MNIIAPKHYSPENLHMAANLFDGVDSFSKITNEHHHMAFFDHPSTALEQVAMFSKEIMYNNLNSHETYDHSNNFRMSRDWQHMEDIHYSSEGLEFIERYEEMESYMGTAYRTSTSYDVCGSYVDVGRFMQGEPECMVDFARRPNAGKFALFLVNSSELGHTRSSAIYNKGVLIQSGIEKLESLGVRCRLISYYVNDQRNVNKWSRSAYFIQSKRYDEPFHMSSVNLLHPSYYRRVVFGLYEISSKFNPYSGYGFSDYDITFTGDHKETVLKEFKNLCQVDEGETIIHIDSLEKEKTLGSICARKDGLKEGVEVIDAWIDEVVDNN